MKSDMSISARRGDGGPVLGSACDWVHAAAGAVLEAHGHEHTGGDADRDEVAGAVQSLDRFGLSQAEILGQTRCIVILRECHRGRDPAQLLKLVQKPGGVEIPPAAAVEDQVEVTANKPEHLLEGTA